jgi:general secretion pathway protein I
MRRSRHGPLPGRSRGFTLLEVLLAFVVFALAFATVLEIVAASTRSTVRARDYSEAALLAQSLAERIGTEIPVEAGSWNGESDNGIAWAVEISDFEGVGDDTRTLELAELNGTRLYWVDLTLTWGDRDRERVASFTTVRGVIEGRSSP